MIILVLGIFYVTFYIFFYYNLHTVDSEYDKNISELCALIASVILTFFMWIFLTQLNTLWKFIVIVLISPSVAIYLINKVKSNIQRKQEEQNKVNYDYYKKVGEN